MSTLPQQLTLPLEKHHNHYLFSDYYLDHLLPRRLDWQEATSEARAAMKRLQTIYAAFTPTENEAQTERDWIRPVLETLDHVFEVQPSIATPDGVRRPDYVFFPTDKARQAAKPLQGHEDYPATALAVGDAKHWDRSLDQTLKGDGRKPRDPFTNRNPSWQIYFYMLHTSLAWGILTNGRAWRLYHKDTAHKLNYYYEVDLPALLGNGDVEAFKYFYLFFRQASFIPNGEGRTWLDIILQESRDYAQGVSEDLKEQVYEALRHVAQGFLDYPGNDLTTDPDTLKAIHDNSLILLYRLLFILYAESRGLLPLQDNETYRLSYSLDAIKKEIERTLSKPILPTSRLYWTRLQELFGAINKGNEHLDVPAYNGDLFNPEKHPFLEQYAVGDQELRQAIDLLARTDTEEGRVFVDYRDLEVRHLGSIYEGLLQYQLRHAEGDLAVVKEEGRERYVPAGEGQEVAVPTGRVYLVTDRGERKATGSYYTPDYIVKYIVEQTLKPLLDETFARWANRKNVTEEDLVNDILSLDVLDPAMGSGHFLVEATEHIARYLAGLGLEATAGMGAEAELDYWKRRVVQACIYGVDLNPLAVELAKLSLWLATVSKDKPLSFLDHHLRCGNSLIGARVADLGAAPMVKKRRRKTEEEEAAGQLSMFEDDAFRQSMMTAVDSMWLIEGTDSSTVEGVKEQERIYRQLRDELTRRYRRLTDLWTACYFGLEVDPAMWLGLVAYATGRAPAQVQQYEAILKQAGAIAEDKRFFHWELEFPEVFFDRFGRPLKEQAGFDAVVANPPYRTLALGRGQEAADKAELDFLRNLFPAAAEYKTNLFPMFLERGLTVAKQYRCVCFILPETLLTNYFFKKLRYRLLQQFTIHSILDVDEKVFADAEIGGNIVIAVCREAPSKSHHIQAFNLDIEREIAATANIPQSDFLRMPDYKLLTEIQSLRLFEKVRGQNPLLDKLAIFYNGIKTGDNRRFLSIERSHPLHRRVIRGRDVERYSLTWGNVYVLFDKERLWSNTNEQMFEAGEKLVVRQTGDRLVAAYDSEQYYTMDTTHLIIPHKIPNRETVRARFLLALYNSALINWYYHQIVPEIGRPFAEVKIVNIKKLPIRRISFTTPMEEQSRLVEVGITEATEWIEGTEGPSVSSVSFSAFSGSNLGRWLDARLTADPEQSDVVHDLLARLAEQMIAVNKEKQAETRGFLSWLADYTGLPIEDWTLKTSLKACYQHDWTEMRRVLDRNSRKIAKVNVKGREASDLIRDEWQASVEKLQPLLARIAATDRLIDLIVYRLYGLTEEEAAVVEGE